jgi:homoserine acetyltransferase
MPRAAGRNQSMQNLRRPRSCATCTIRSEKISSRKAVTISGVDRFTRRGGWSKSWDANALIIRYLASRNHDASVPFGGDMKAALARIQAKTLLLTSQTDRTIPAYLSRELYAGIKNAQYIEIPTIRGHLGGAAPLKGSAEEAYITDRIRPFLDSL